LRFAAASCAHGEISVAEDRGGTADMRGKPQRRSDGARLSLKF
jgi:hypothetical protein